MGFFDGRLPEFAALVSFMHFVYIIYSKMAGRFYVGESAFPESRVIEHNTGKYQHASTKIAKDWQLMKIITCSKRSDALQVERYIKSMKSKRFIEQLINETSFSDRFREILFEKFAINIS